MLCLVVITINSAKHPAKTPASCVADQVKPGNYYVQHKKSAWAARYITGLLAELMLKGVVSSFLFLQ